MEDVSTNNSVNAGSLELSNMDLENMDQFGSTETDTGRTFKSGAKTG